MFLWGIYLIGVLVLSYLLWRGYLMFNEFIMEHRIKKSNKQTCSTSSILSDLNADKKNDKSDTGFIQFFLKSSQSISNILFPSEKKPLQANRYSSMDEANDRYDEQLNAESDDIAIIMNEFDAFIREARILVQTNLSAQDEEAPSDGHDQYEQEDYDAIDAIRLVELMNGYPNFPEDEYKTVDDYVAGLEAYSLKRAAYHEEVVCLAQRILPRLQVLLADTSKLAQETSSVLQSQP